MEMRDLFNEYAKEMYPQSADGQDGGEGEAEGEMDIEKEIQAELDEMKKPARGQLFTHVRVNLQCGESGLEGMVVGRGFGADKVTQWYFSKRSRLLYPRIWSRESAKTP